MLTRSFIRRFALSAETKGKVFSAVRAYKDERSREIANDLKAKGDNASLAETDPLQKQLIHLAKEVTEASLWKDFGFDGLDEVECLLVVEDELGIKIPDDEFHAIHGMEAALKVVEKYAPKEHAEGK